MNGLLIRVGADLSKEGGGWNGPADSQTREFAYVAIPETKAVHPGLERPFQNLAPVLSTFGIELPLHLQAAKMHLDPDFDHLTYGDVGRRATQIRNHLCEDDFIAFYASLRDTRTKTLIYALIGLFIVEKITLAKILDQTDRNINAHSRRILSWDSDDIVVCAKQNESGRLSQYLPIGGWRDRSYRVFPNVLTEWGGLSVKDGFLQRSGTLPRFLDPLRFRHWFEGQSITMLSRNN